MEQCPFCLINAGAMEAPVVFADNYSLAFLDHRPLFPGHTLLIPRVHVMTLVDLPLVLVEPLFTNVRLLATAIRCACGCDGTFIAMNNGVSQSVPHLHIHIVPRRKKDGLKGFFWPRQKYQPGEEQEMARLIRQVAETLAKGEQQTCPQVGG